MLEVTYLSYGTEDVLFYVRSPEAPVPQPGMKVIIRNVRYKVADVELVLDEWAGNSTYRVWLEAMSY